VAEPPPPPFLDRFFKLPTAKSRPLQRRILEYLSRGGRPSINAISRDLDVWRFSAQRCLQALKNHGLVEDQWVYVAPDVVPGIKAHTFHITDRGRRELKFMQCIGQAIEPIPLGWRILLHMSHGALMTIGQIAKMVDKDRGEVRRTVKSLHNAGMVDCLWNRTRASLGQDMITHLYRITEFGRQVLDAGQAAYMQIIVAKKVPRRGAFALQSCALK